jgi:signal transduction histidine kinase/CheY-like chemotaxis protein
MITSTTALKWPSASGDCARLLRDFDWSRSRLGEPAGWPQILRASVDTLLRAPIGMALLWGEDGIIIYNDAYSRVASKKHPSVFALPVSEAWPEVADFVRDVTKSVRQGSPVSLREQLLVLQRNGIDEDVWFDLDFSEVVHDDGSFAGVLAAVIEITDKVHLANKLKLEQEASAELNRRLAAETADLRQLFQEAPGFMCVLRGPMHVFELTNASYMRLLGQRDLIGKSVREAVPDAEGQGYFELLDKVFRTGERYVGNNWEIALEDPKTRQMRKRFLDFVYQPIRGRDGRVTGIFVEGVDVTERSLAEGQLRNAVAALEASDQRKDEFLAMLGHELRNPLAPIATAAAILKDAETIGFPAIERARAVIERQARHLSEIVEELLDVARITSGKINLKKDYVEIGAAIERAVEQVGDLMEKSGHRFDIALPQLPIYVIGDLARITQVLSNLLNNAGKYCEPGGAISLTAAADGAGVLIRVKDNGIGIAPDVLPHIFDLFTQGRRALDRAQGGLGVGLTVVRRLVELHGGRVAANSTGPGQGSEFSVWLPAAPVQTTNSAGNAVAAIAGAASRRVMVVDDNRDAADMLSEILTMQGHTVRTVYSGIEVMPGAREFRPDVILLDIGLPGMSGYEVASTLRSSGDLAPLMLIALTGYGQDADRRQSHDHGFDLHLIKPVDFEALNGIINGQSGFSGDPRRTS